VRILFINNFGSGFADHLEVPEGTTAEKLFLEQIPHGSPRDYLIRVNRLPVSAGQVLCEGDRITITPTKIEGARS
jgi:hypothetical protein